MSCVFCEGMLGECPVCNERTKPTHMSWEERLNLRRHQGTHEFALQRDDDQPENVKRGLHSINNPNSDLVGPKYSRAFNSKYNGPGKGTW